MNRYDNYPDCYNPRFGGDPSQAPDNGDRFEAIDNEVIDMLTGEVVFTGRSERQADSYADTKNGRESAEVDWFGVEDDNDFEEWCRIKKEDRAWYVTLRRLPRTVRTKRPIRTRRWRS